MSIKLTFQRKHISIDIFTEIEVPDFVVLTGVNGSGKSHLLEAIENRSVITGSAYQQRIVRFDYRNFYLENEAAYNARQIIDERNNAWNFFQQQDWKNTIESHKNNLGTHYQKLIEVTQVKNKSFWELTESDIASDDTYQAYKKYKTDLNNFTNQDSFKNNQQAQSVMSIMRRAACSIDELDKDDFDEAFKPYQFKNDFLPNQLGKIIWDYYSRYRNNEVNEFQKEKYPKKANYAVLSEGEFEAKHGKKPWLVLNEILENFGTIEYRFPSPEGSEYFSDFQLRLVHKDDDNLKLDFSALSSGEKVLMALIAAIYKTSSDNHFPDVLLLDEIDASLHPSMVRNLLDAIQNIFIGRGTKVLLVTHSPTTVALAPEESVYVMNKTGPNRIEKISRNSAVNILTEGFATLDEGLRVFSEISKSELSIISEGHNRKLIKEALRHSGITDVECVDGLSWCGETELKTIFDFLKKIPHDSKVLVVWDPDMESKYRSLLEENNTIPLVLPKNEANKLTKKPGIENLFEEQLFRDGSFVITVSDGAGVTKDEHFDESKKSAFAEYVIGRNNKDDYKNFKPLIDKITEMKKTNVT